MQDISGGRDSTSALHLKACKILLQQRVAATPANCVDSKIANSLVIQSVGHVIILAMHVIDNHHSKRTFSITTKSVLSFSENRYALLQQPSQL